MSKRHHTYFRDMKSWRFSKHKIPKSFKTFAKTRIIPLIKFDGYKQKQKEKIALHCIHNLALTRLRTMVVADSRDDHYNRLRISVWDAIIEAKLCRVCVGNEMTKQVSRYRATGKLVKLLELNQDGQYIDPRLAYNTQRKKPTKEAYIHLHSGKTDLETGKKLPKNEQKQLLPLLPIELPPEVVRYLVNKEKRIAECNRINRTHSWWIAHPDPKRSQTPYEPNFNMKGTFSGRVGRWGRMVSWSPLAIGQLSSKERKTITIDEEKVTELDFGEFDIRRHYHYHGIDPAGDAYKPELILPRWYSSQAATIKKKKIVRKFLKLCTNILLNVPSEATGRRAIGSILRKQPKRRRRFLWKVFFEYEEIYASAPTQLTERILSVHADIKHVFCNDKFGPMMMTLGGEMMEEIRWKLAKRDKPCYTINDSILCKRSDRSYAKRVMRSVYRRYNLVFKPVIKVKF